MPAKITLQENSTTQKFTSHLGEYILAKNTPEIMALKEKDVIKYVERDQETKKYKLVSKEAATFEKRIKTLREEDKDAILYVKEIKKKN